MNTKYPRIWIAAHGGVRKALEVPGKPVEVLVVLARVDDWQVQWTVARLRDTPADVLWELAESENPAVRGAVAGNLWAPLELLEKLAEDEDWTVRGCVATNSSVSDAVLKKLLEDEAHSGRQWAKAGLTERAITKRGGWPEVQRREPEA